MDRIHVRSPATKNTIRWTAIVGPQRDCLVDNILAIRPVDELNVQVAEGCLEEHTIPAIGAAWQANYKYLFKAQRRVVYIVEQSAGACSSRADAAAGEAVGEGPLVKEQ
jgi:hypothetical protein